MTLENYEWFVKAFFVLVLCGTFLFCAILLQLFFLLSDVLPTVKILKEKIEGKKKQDAEETLEEKIDDLVKESAEERERKLEVISACRSMDETLKSCSALLGAVDVSASDFEYVSLRRSTDACSIVSACLEKLRSTREQLFFPVLAETGDGFKMALLNGLRNYFCKAFEKIKKFFSKEPKTNSTRP